MIHIIVGHGKRQRRRCDRRLPVGGHLMVRFQPSGGRARFRLDHRREINGFPIHPLGELHLVRAIAKMKLHTPSVAEFLVQRVPQCLEGVRSLLRLQHGPRHAHPDHLVVRQRLTGWHPKIALQPARRRGLHPLRQRPIPSPDRVRLSPPRRPAHDIAIIHAFRIPRLSLRDGTPRMGRHGGKQEERRTPHGRAPRE